MTDSIVVWWGIFLAAALIVTLVDVYLLLRVVDLCRQIYVLTKLTLTAARGIAKNTDAGQALGQTIRLVTSLAKKSGDVEKLTGTIGQQLSREM